jgi:hypothetical protein
MQRRVRLRRKEHAAAAILWRITRKAKDLERTNEAELRSIGFAALFQNAEERMKLR